MPRLFTFHFTASSPQPIERQQFASLPIRIGRNALNDCKLPFNFISDFHARLDDSNGRLTIEDLNSRNGVFVRRQGNATRIPSGAAVELAHSGNEFFLGPNLRVMVEISEAPGWQPERAFTGSVLGNRAMLGSEHGADPALGAGGVPSLPPLDGQLRAPEPLPGPSYARAPSSYPPAAQEPPRGNQTEQFSLSLESLALVGLTELAASLIPGQHIRTSGDLARLITRLHDAVEVFCRCFIPLREGHAQFVASMDLQRAASQRSMHRSPSYRRVESARTPQELAFALLDFRDQATDSVSAIDGIFADLMLHQVALLDGVMQGVRALLDELSPENIEHAVDQQRSAVPLGLGRHKALWQEYKDRFADLNEEKEALLRIFGPEFARAYREYNAKRRGE